VVIGDVGMMKQINIYKRIPLKISNEGVKSRMYIDEITRKEIIKYLRPSVWKGGEWADYQTQWLWIGSEFIATCRVIGFDGCSEMFDKTKKRCHFWSMLTIRSQRSHSWNEVERKQHLSREQGLSQIKRVLPRVERKHLRKIHDANTTD